jgi:hypothetical protein
LEGRGASAGELVFEIPEEASKPGRSVYACCCCNAELCVDEQFRSYVQFKWETPVEEPTGSSRSTLVGKECIEIGRNMPSANRLTIRISTPSVNLPVRIARIIAA